MKRIVTAFVVLLAGFAAISGCASPARDSAAITVAFAPFESVGLLFAAQDQDMFADNGLQVTYREYPTGVAALEAVQNGEADIAVGTAEFPLVGKACQGASVSAIASIDRPDFIYLVGRKDHGIGGPDDLSGKRIGTTAGSAAQFYLGRFLELRGMTPQDITFVDLKTPDAWRAAIADGSVDAVVLAQPEAAAVRDSLGGDAAFFSVQGNQPAYTLAISNNEWIDNNPVLVERFLTALSQAEEFVGENPSEAGAIIQKRLELDATYMESLWAQNNYALSLDQSLIVAMEDEARWMIRNELTTATVVPDFGDYIHVEGLEAVSPGAVNIVR